MVDIPEAYWRMERTKLGAPVAALYDEKLLVAKIYLSGDHLTLRIVLPEMSDAAQVKIDTENHLIDFRRKL